MTIKNKKSQANILLVILIILMILILMIVIWNIVYSTIKQGGGKVSIEQFKVKLNFDENNAVTIKDNIITVRVYRGTGKGDLKAIKFIFKDNNGNQKIIEKKSPLPNELETLEYTFTQPEFDLLENINDISTITKVSFIPMFEDDNGDDIYGMESEEVEVSEGEPCVGDNDCNIGETCNEGNCVIPEDCFGEIDEQGRHQICTCNDLDNVRTDLTRNYILNNNIDCSEFENFQPLGIFTGILDGDYHYIYGLEMIMPKDVGGALFNEISSEAIIKNLGLKEINFQSLENTQTNLCKMGGITVLNRGTIENCYVKGSLINKDSNGNNYLGGIAGINHGTIKESYTNVAISGKSKVGGLVGENYQGIIQDCYSLGSVSGIEDGEPSIYTGQLIGGLVGIQPTYYDQTINCYSAGSVEGKNMVGGLVGQRNGKVTNSYSTTFVNIIESGSYIGGLIGANERLDLWTNNWWFNQPDDNVENCIGNLKIVTCNPESNQENFHSSSHPVYSTWDFTPETGIWKEQPNNFPIFQWQSLTD